LSDPRASERSPRPAAAAATGSGGNGGSLTPAKLTAARDERPPAAARRRGGRLGGIAQLRRWCLVSSLLFRRATELTVRLAGATYELGKKSAQFRIGSPFLTLRLVKALPAEMPSGFPSNPMSMQFKRHSFVHRYVKCAMLFLCDDLLGAGRRPCAASAAGSQAGGSGECGLKPRSFDDEQQPTTPRSAATAFWRCRVAINQYLGRGRESWISTAPWRFFQSLRNVKVQRASKGPTF
jgi:hypothetical protein